MSLSDYGEALLLDALLAKMPFHVGLSTADPGEDGSGLVEPTDASYARVVSSAFSRIGSTISNTAIVPFVASSESWGIITHFVLLDAAGNVLFSDTINAGTPITVESGDTVKFAIGALTGTLD